MVEHIHEETAFGWGVWGTCAIPRLWGDTQRGRTERVLESPSETAWAVALGSSCPLCAELALTWAGFVPCTLRLCGRRGRRPGPERVAWLSFLVHLGSAREWYAHLCSTAATLVFKLQVRELPGRRGSLARGGGWDYSPLHSLPSRLTSA